MSVTEELHKIILEYEKETGNPPDELKLTRSAMDDLMKEDLTCSRWIYNADGTEVYGSFIAFCGIPINVTHYYDDSRIIATGKIDILNPFVRRYITSDCLKDEGYYYCMEAEPDTFQEIYSIMKKIRGEKPEQEDRQEQDVTDEELIALLNAGGFHAVLP